MLKVIKLQSFKGVFLRSVSVIEKNGEVGLKFVISLQSHTLFADIIDLWIMISDLARFEHISLFKKRKLK